MGILGINNRTENWKTVQHFHGLSDAAKVELVRRLGEPKDTVAEEIGIELFWHGIRDYAYEHKVENDDLVGVYERLFKDLRKDIDDFEHAHEFKEMQKHNYGVPVSNRKGLANNVRHTEVDVVLETPRCIYIGEAKYESPLGANSEYVLVHQLIRQYVTTSILVDLAGRKKCVVPFVVAEDGDSSVTNSGQVKFMIKKGWLRECNVLSWGDINDIRIGRR